MEGRMMGMMGSNRIKADRENNNGMGNELINYDLAKRSLIERDLVKHTWAGKGFVPTFLLPHLQVIALAVAVLVFCLSFLPTHTSVLLVSDSSVSTFAAAGDVTSKRSVECYSSVYVQAGDSLWSISNRYYSGEYRSLKRYMKRIMKLNHMETTTVYADTYLVVPYYTH